MSHLQNSLPLQNGPFGAYRDRIFSHTLSGMVEKMRYGQQGCPSQSAPKWPILQGQGVLQVAPMSIRLICAADIHFGRIAPVAEAWERLIDQCLCSSADALLLAGDIADDESLFFEIYPLFRKGMERLRAAQIPVVVIAGNHDGKILTQMERSLGFHLLGKDGKWERITLSCRGRALHIDGLSFVEGNPLHCYDLPPVPAGEPLIGMLHCDLDGPLESPYSPVSRRELSQLPHTAWVVGHIHVPRIVQEQPMILSCGSLQGLDISEVGIHGAWLVEIDSKLTAQLIPLAPLRWEIIELDVTDEEELELRLQLEMERALGGMAGKVRFILRGRTALTRPLICPEGVESIQNCIQPPIDLKKVAEGSDLPALLARELLDLREMDVCELLQRSLQTHPYLKQMPESWPKTEEIGELLREQGMALLSELMEQRRAP